jgi:hypothetical protein
MLLNLIIKLPYFVATAGGQMIMASSSQRLVQTAPGGAIMVSRPQGQQQQQAGLAIKKLPKKPTQKDHLKKPLNVFFSFLFFFLFLIFYENNRNFSL